MSKNKKSLLSLVSTVNISVLIGILAVLIIYIVPTESSSAKMIISLLIGSSFGFLIYIIMYLSEKLSKLTIRDELTGLYNLTYLSEWKDKIVAQSNRSQKKMGVLIAEVDNQNDIIRESGQKGHGEVLRYVGRGFAETSRVTEFLFRLEEDHFLIFFMDINEYSNIKVIRNRMDQYFQKPLIYNKKTIDVKLEFGYAVYPEDGDSFDAVMNVAKQRLYVAQSR